jgi:hypothetical protein
MRRVPVTIAVVAAVLASGMAVATEPPMHASHRNVAGRLVPATALQNAVNNLGNFYTPKQLEEGVYVGDEFCIACHSWAAITRDTKHRQALRTPYGANSLIPGRGVVADYDQNGVDDFMQGLDFNQIASVFDPYKPNAPILSYTAADDSYWITIGELRNKVVITQGGTGEWKQRYLLRVPVSGTADGYSNENYVSPVQYNESTHAYVLYDPGDWYDASNQPKFNSTTTVAELAANNGRTYSKKCIGCHTTGIRELYRDDNGEWIYRPYVASLVNPDRAEQYPDYDHDGIPDIVNIGCEACHGPGSAHILGGGDPSLILAPSTLATREANAICQQCHVRVKSVPGAVHDWPYRDDVGEAWIPGVTEAPIDDFYTDADGNWPDGTHAKQHHQQWQEFYRSSKPEFEFHPVKCVECHSPHQGGRHMIVTQIVDGTLEIPTQNENNTLCLACHATHGAFEEITTEQVAAYYDNLDHIENVVEAHTHHPYAPERSMGLSRCSTCHMSTTAKTAIDYDIHTHTFEVVAPDKTLMYQANGGMPNACAVSCHALKVNSFGLGLDPAIATWNAQYDVDLANALRTYFGPGGLWWDTDHPMSVTGGILENALPPGSYQLPESFSEFD